MYKSILKITSILFLGALGALIFNLFIFPYILTNSYFENFQFVKDFKQGKIVVNQKEQVYIQENRAIEDAIERVKNSIVTIQSASLGLTSGFVATSDGSIIMLAGAVPANGKFNVFLQRESVDFKVVRIDNKNNLALLKTDRNNLQTVGFADFNKIKLGQKVFLAVPTSIKQDNWLANEGIIREVDKDTIKTNISEKPMANGSPLFNSAGELVGLNFIDSENKISVVPINKIRNY